MQLTVTGLPAREGQALSLVAQGMTTKRAARDMHCSPRNVEALLENSMRRMDAKNRVHLVAIAFERGVLRATAFCLVVVMSAGMFPAPAAQASDDDPYIRRVRSRPSGRGTRRLSGHDHFPDAGKMVDDFIQFHNLQPTLIWDDELLLTYQ
jgi:DNA-binding CsgD family transcriptional regulator